MRILLIAITLFLSDFCFGKKIKVACVGNSITYGAGIVNREKNSYPAQLQVYLGDKYEVRNFGSNGATALHKGEWIRVKADKNTWATASSSYTTPDDRPTEPDDMYKGLVAAAENNMTGWNT